MKRSLCILIVLVCVATARAQSHLTLSDCLAEALRNNPDLLAARESVEKSNYDYKGSRSDNLPQLSANAGRTRSYRETSTPGEDSTSDGNSIGVAAKQALFTGGRNSAAIESAAAGKESAEIQLQAAKAQLSYDVLNAFAGLLYAQEQIGLAEAIAKRRADDVDLIELRYEGGKEHQGSLLRTQAAHRESVFDVTSAQRALDVARRRMARALGRAESDPIAVKGTLEADRPGPSPDFAELAEETPDHKLTLAQLRVARAGVRSAKSGYYPDITASAEASRAGDNWPPEEDQWSVGVSLSFPFFPGGRNYMDVKSAEAELRRAEASARGSDDQVLLDLEQAYRDYEDAVERTDVQAEFLKAAEVRAEIARSQYTTGLLSFEDWDVIENDLIQQQKALLANQREAMVAQAAWEKAQGRHRLPEGLY